MQPRLRDQFLIFPAAHLCYIYPIPLATSNLLPGQLFTLEISVPTKLPSIRDGGGYKLCINYTRNFIELESTE